MPPLNPTSRFTDRVDDYVRYRPGYPEGVVPFLEAAAGLAGPVEVADVGSGTGLSAALFLGRGHTVYAVEPNAAMRAAAEASLGDEPGFHSVDGTAEATTLADASVDLVVAAQAFHWFEPASTRREWRRILRPGGAAALFWNRRRMASTPFLVAYEALLRRYGTDYGAVRHDALSEDALRAFLGPFRKRVFDNAQVLDYDGLRGRLCSSSYVPAEGTPGYRPMIEDLERLFEAHAVDGCVRIDYDTEVYLGALGHGRE